MKEILNQGGYPSKERYKISLSEKFIILIEEAKKQCEDTTWTLLADRGRTFPLLTAKVSEMHLSNASGEDIGDLISYFYFRDKSMEEIMNNLKYENI